MARSRSTKSGRRSKAKRSTSSRARSRNGSGRDDAINLLKGDHREVEKLFSQFESARSAERQQEIAQRICESLKTHATIEEEIFYPAFLEATQETDLHHEAEIEHEGATRLIEEIEATGSSDDHFEARVTVLREMIRHHVKEEEQRGGMFSKAQKSDMDLVELGRQLLERKLELTGESAEMGDIERRPPPQSRTRRGGRDMRST